MKRNIAFGTIALLVGQCFAGDALADCGSVTDATTTCSGDNTSISYTDGSVTTIDIEDLTSDIGGDTAVQLEQTADAGSGQDSDDNGNPGTDGSALTVDGNFDDGYGIDADSIGIQMVSAGGAGAAGADSDKQANDGGQGGEGGKLIVTLSGGETLSAGEVGLLLETVGGDGGDAGSSADYETVAVGGSGAAGGVGGDVSVTFSDGFIIDVSGDNAETGIFIISKGGDGGAGADTGDSGSDTPNTGGNGAVGGNGGDIIVTANGSESTIRTSGVNNHGVFAESLGGDGGAGGSADAGDQDTTGGDGAAGGDGGNVEVDLYAAVTVVDEESQGIYARSFGGAGGDGGEALGSKGDKKTDGSGGGGGNGGTVTVTYQGIMETEGSESNGILAQSVGGFIGDTGDTTGLVAWGAGDRSSGDGGAVAVSLTSARITTGQTTSSGIEAQSIGGGGGKGSSAADSFDTLGATSSEAGGNGGTVDVELTDSTIITAAQSSPGIAASSIGGGGGSGGSESGVTSVGSTAGSGGAGGDITLTFDSSTVSTKGVFSKGVYASTVGGGGGNALSTSGIAQTGGNGGDGGAGGTITATLKGSGGNVTTTVDISDGIHLQSVGGGGGNGANSVAVSTTFEHTVGGGSGGAGGAGGSVTYTDTGETSVMTSGTHSRGLVAQSIGGGGGHAGNDLTASASFGLSINVGGAAKSSGGDGSDGDTVSVTHAGSVETEGDLSTGILAHSVGGSGGSGGTTISIEADITDIDSSHSHNIGSSGGDGGNGGDVNIDVSGTVSTSGISSDGVLAQSIGGSGGIGGALYSIDTESLATTLSFSSSNSVDHNVGSGGAGGEAGTVSVTVSDDVTTSGAVSNGIVAQSIAGGGGNGGTTLAITTLSMGTLNTTIGSNGGQGGKADTVVVANSGSVKTTGHQSSGILAQSIGGSGGNAGTVVASNDFDASLNFTMGGSGGNGSAGGDVIVVNDGSVTTASGTDVTTGDNSAAIIAQSIGGGGGNGGKVIDADVSIGTFQASFGGSGAEAGSSGNVSVTNGSDATLKTSGTYAYGILAQSVAGDGGNGGSVVNVAADAGEISGAVTFTLGGKGGTGGTSQEVNVTNGGQITTTGFAAMGVVAQTVGGDGGSGGTVVSGEVSLSSDSSVDVQYSFGGDGGGGGQAGDALVVNSGQITTGSHFADALYVQSIGGNGGVGGSSYAALVTVTEDDNISSTVSVGGGGGEGGLAGDVAIINSGKLQTSGGNSNTIYAQSVGGNGGDGGSGVTMLANFGATDTQSMTTEITASVGGGGGSGNDAGSVYVGNSGSILAEADVSRAIFAQSVGGGGGDGGSAAQYTVGYMEAADEEDDSSSSFAFNLTVGGNGGGGGTGDTVTVENTGDITTYGIASYGIFAQSVGGSGGNGGDGQLNLSGWVADVADIAQAINQAQTVYDDLTDPSSLFSDYQIDIGGNGGASSNGGEVDVSSTSTITTQGNDATAIFAQSVGGGGGSGGDGSQGLAISVTAGGFGSKGGTGGAVNVTTSDTIQTTGDRAMGIFAQSVGGGGGAAGDVEAGLANALEDLTIGTDVVGDGKSGDGGDGGAVTVTANGDINTASVLAHGIFAQSIGGGGGGEGRFDLDTSGGMSNVEAALGSAGNEGNGGDVDVTVGGAMSVQGEFAAGVFAQSVGGKDSTGGDVTVTVSGSIDVSGRAIVTHSEGGSGGGANKVIIDEGATVSSNNGSDGYDTVSMLNGSSIELTNSGTLENTSDDASSYVIKAGGTTSTITNSGTLKGSVDLTVDGNYGNLTNSGTFNMGSDVDLGLDANKLTNTGTMSPGGSGTISTTTVTAQDGLEMSSDGIYLVDVTLGDTDSADMISVSSGGAGTIDLGSGTVTPNVISSLPSSGDSGSVDIMTVDVDDGIDNVDTTTVTDSSTVDYTLSTTGSGTTTLTLGYSVDYSGVGDTGLTDSSSDFAVYFDTVVSMVQTGYDEDSDEYNAVSDLATVILNTRSGEDLDALYDEHVLNEAGASMLSARRAALDLHNLLHSCPDLAHDPLAGFLRQQDCYWFNAAGGGFSQDRMGHNPGYDEAWAGFSGGLQREVADDVFVELAGLFDLYWLDGDNFDQDGYRAYGGGVVKREIGNHTLSATLSGGVFGYDYDRTYRTKSGTQSASGDPFGGFIGGELRASTLFNNNRNYIKPSVGLAAIHLWQDSFTEQGDGGLEWQINSASESYFALRPSVEVGRSLTINENPATIYARVGLTAFLNNPDVALGGEFAGFNGLMPTHDLKLGSDRYFGELEVGVDASLDSATTLSITAQGALSKNSWAAGGGLNLRRRF